MLDFSLDKPYVFILPRETTAETMAQGYEETPTSAMMYFPGRGDMDCPEN